MVPGRLIQLSLGQISPALCATGTTGTPARQAIAAPDLLNFLRVPGAMRVPSGKISTVKPSLRRWVPTDSTCLSALAGWVRSSGIGSSSFSPQPKTGIFSSSCLSTVHSGRLATCR